MYRHEKTREGEYPRTCREVLHQSMNFLEEAFPERTIVRKVNADGWLSSVPAYSWDGAGSERGGSAEHIRYEKIVFLPEKRGKVSVVSVGDRQFDHQHTVLIYDEEYGDLSDLDTRTFASPSYYSVLFLQTVTPSLAENMLSCYHTYIENKDYKGYYFEIALEEILEGGTRHFVGAPFFAFDSSLSCGTFALNRNGFVESFSSDLQKFLPGTWKDCLRGNVEERKKLSQFFSDYVQEKDSALFQSELTRMRRLVEGLRDSQEKKVLSYLEKVAQSQ